MRRSIQVVPALLAFGVLAACSGDFGIGGIKGVCDMTNPVSRITVDPSSITLFFRPPPLQSDGIQLRPTAFSRFGTTRTDIIFSYSSSDSAIVAVTDSGFVTPVGVGNATVTVSACEQVTTAGIVVVPDSGAITVTLASDTVVVGDSVLASARATAPGGGVMDSAAAVFSWSSEPASVAGVTPTGDTLAIVRTLAAGTAIISASTDGTIGSASLVVIPAATH